MFISHAGLWMQSLKSNLISKPPSQAPSGGGVGVVSHGDENLIVPPSDSTSPPLLSPPGPLSQPFGARSTTSASLIRGPPHAAKC